MAVQLFRLAHSSPATTDTKYFYTLSAALTVTADGSQVLSITNWVKGDGATITAGDSFASVTNGYYKLCINGILQQSAIFTVVVDSAVHLVASAAAMSIAQSAPITLEAANLTPAVVAVP